MTFDATREAGLARLDDFIPRAGRAYAAERNTDRGPADRTNVSTLTPWVRHRLVTEREVVEAVLQRHSLDAASTFVQEVYWRTYWKGWLELRPSMWARYTASIAPALGSLSTADRATYDDAVAGRTGIDGFDDWARELVELGYLHNHARMWFASIWIFTLGLPWQLGADFFLRHLLDGDPASNTLSWRWVAGLQTVGKTYLASDGLSLIRALRQGDALAWPHATRGFFPFRESIPALLREQQIGLERHSTAQTGDNGR